jgi:tryptophanyl-tRNA synthetase
VDAEGRLLLQSAAFDAPKDAGQAIAQLQKDPDALQALQARLVPVAGVSLSDAAAALHALAQAAAA